MIDHCHAMNCRTRGCLNQGNGFAPGVWPQALRKQARSPGKFVYGGQVQQQGQRRWWNVLSGATVCGQCSDAGQ